MTNSESHPDESAAPGAVPPPEGNPAWRWLTALLAALQCLTIVPPIVRRSFTAAEMGGSVGFFPLIGLLLGGALAGLDLLLNRFLPKELTAALVLAIWVLLSGAIHLDGFLDSCDGLWGGGSPEERLKIMHDARVGAFAVIAGVLLILVKYAALVDAPARNAALLLAPVLGRWGMAFAIVFFPYARPEGLGHAMKAHAGGIQIALAAGTALAAAWFAGHGLGLAALALAAVAAWAIARFASGRLGGLTGDIYGAIGEVVEVVVLIAFVAGGSHEASAAP